MTPHCSHRLRDGKPLVSVEPHLCVFMCCSCRPIVRTHTETGRLMSASDRIVLHSGCSACVAGTVQSIEKRQTYHRPHVKIRPQKVGLETVEHVLQLSSNHPSESWHAFCTVFRPPDQLKHVHTHCIKCERFDRVMKKMCTSEREQACILHCF